jgi:hypothetical protein
MTQKQLLVCLRQFSRFGSTFRDDCYRLDGYHRARNYRFVHQESATAPGHVVQLSRANIFE